MINARTDDAYRWTLALLVSYWVSMSAYSGVLASEDFDASQITWAHAVNNRSELDKALNSQVSFLEADVMMGSVIGQQGEKVIMAHPPVVESDISLAEWLDIVYKTDPDRGVKLDFKSSHALKEAKDVLNNRQLPRTLWLNADILPGPVIHFPSFVSPEELLALCQSFPGNTLSPGWTTVVPDQCEKEHCRYSWQDVWQMYRTLACQSQDQKCSHITFPVRAILLRYSIAQLTWLISSVGPNASLTVWSGKTDNLQVQDLLYVRRAFPKSQVYYDLPDDQATEFEKIKDTVSYQEDVSFNPTLWGVLRRESEPFGCDEATNVSAGVHILYGGRRDVAVVYNKALTYPLEITATLVPYELADYDNEYSVREGDLNVVLATSPTFWEGEWWKESNTGQSAVAFGITEPNANKSDCILSWTFRLNNAADGGQLTTNGKNCSVDVTKFQVNWTDESVFWVGFVFRGQRAMVLENVQITGTEVQSHPSSGLSPFFSTSTLLLTAAVLFIASWFL